MSFIREATVKKYVVEVSLFNSPAMSAAASAIEAIPPTLEKRAAHAPGFASVNWFGRLYSFTPTQRRIVAVLWTAWEQGTPDVDERTILSEAMSESKALAELFRGNPAFGQLIQRSSCHGGPCGCFRLAQPGGDS